MRHPSTFTSSGSTFSHAAVTHAPADSHRGSPGHSATHLRGVKTAKIDGADATSLQDMTC
jgi:hypothetical protein